MRKPEQDSVGLQRIGDSRALEQVLEAMAPELLPVALHLIDEGRAEGLVRETLRQAMEATDRCEQRDLLRSWLVDILTKAAREMRCEAKRFAGPIPLASRACPSAGGSDGKA